MPDIFEDADHEALDRICDFKYKKTFEKVVSYLSTKHPMGLCPRPPTRKTIVPDRIAYEHAPDGIEIQEIVGEMLPDRKSDPYDRARRKELASEVEDNIHKSVQYGIEDAVCEMNDHERFRGRQQAHFKVTERKITLVRLFPITIPLFE